LLPAELRLEAEYPDGDGGLKKLSAIIPNK
jgi:hypothetical protein